MVPAQSSVLDRHCLDGRFPGKTFSSHVHLDNIAMCALPLKGLLAGGSCFVLVGRRNLCWSTSIVRFFN